MPLIRLIKQEQNGCEMLHMPEHTTTNTLRQRDVLTGQGSNSVWARNMDDVTPILDKHWCSIQ